MIVTTKRGDKGQTSLFGAKRIPKHHPLIIVNGELDELQVLIGLARTKIQDSHTQDFLLEIQKTTYQVMAHIANAKKLSQSQIMELTDKLEQAQTKLLEKTKLANKFVIPGENEAEISCHLVRVYTRSFERSLSRYSSKYPTLKRLLPYFNRLSDYFFVLSQSLLK